MLTESNDFHTVLQANDPTELTIIPTVPLVCKISAKGYLAPCKLFIEQNSASDLEVYCSLKDKKPDKKNHLFKWVN